MKSTNNLFRFIHRRRHSAGFGVHSPFAFNLILDTIHTPHSFYIYEENRQKIDKAGLTKQTDIKYAELIFRLINRFNAKDILEIGAGLGVNSLYISSHSRQTTVVCVEENKEKTEIAQSLLANKSENIIFTNVLPNKENSFDAIIWDLMEYPLRQEETLDTIYNSIRDDGFIVVNHINKGIRNKNTWQEILKMDTITMSFDLKSIGIGFFKSSLPKLNYDLYF